MAIYPTPEQMQSLLAGPADQPVVMLNLLRFSHGPTHRTRASPEKKRTDATRRRCRRSSSPKGGRFLWIGRVDSQVIGTGGEGFHMIGLVEYPSRQTFLEIATDPHVEQIGVHRAAGLESQWLIAATAGRAVASGDRR
jgi:hypothetical protein